MNVFAIAMAAAVQAPDAGRADSSDWNLPNRLDCRATYTVELSGEPRFRAQPIDYSFILPIGRVPGGERPTIQILKTIGDGRSWIEQGTIAEINQAPWPDFAGVIQVGDTLIHLRSDPALTGRISFESVDSLNHGGESRGVGACRFLPDSSQVQSR